MPSPRQDIRGGYCGKQSDRELVFMDIRMVYTNVDGVVGVAEVVGTSFTSAQCPQQQTSAVTHIGSMYAEFGEEF